MKKIYSQITQKKEKIYTQKFQLVHLGKLADNQLAQSQNLLVTDERTTVKIFTDVAGASKGEGGSAEGRDQ